MISSAIAMDLHSFCPSKKRQHSHRCYTKEEALELAKRRTTTKTLWTIWHCMRCTHFHVGRPSQHQIRKTIERVHRTDPEYACMLRSYLTSRVQYALR